MKFTSLLIAATLLLTIGSRGSSAPVQHDSVYTSNYENVLGTSLELKLLAASPAQSQAAEAAALAEIDREAKILSSWDPDSEFSRWFHTRSQPVPVSCELFEVLRLFDHWRDSTNGALDASAEVVSRVWQAAAAQQRMPTPAELAAAVASVHQRHWTLDVTNRTATHTSGAPIAMNSFVKSYIVGRAATAALGVAGVHAAVVNIGGDLVVRGQWTEPVNIADPKSDAENGVPIAHLLVRDRAVATSGDYRRGVVIAGRHFSHIVDPRTAMPADEIISSTVVATDAATAGALATSFSVLTPAESRRLAASLPDVQYLLVTKEGTQIASDGWRALEAPLAPVSSRPALATPLSDANDTAVRFLTVSAQAPAPAKKPSVAAGPLWNREFELTINVELALIPGQRINRPFVAAWIEDEKHDPLKTIALWYGKNKYLPELLIWYHDMGLGTNSTQEINYISSISSSTRPPGKYSLRWDGRDGSGKYIKAGKYTVLIEASREHGTYQIIRREMDFSGVPQQIDLPGGEEIASASLDYHKIAH